MTIRMATENELKEFFQWHSFWHRGKGFKEFARSSDIAFVEHDGILGCGIMVHKIQNSTTCYLNFLTRNPFCDRQLSSVCTDFMVQNLKKVTKLNGCKFFISLTDEEPCKKRFRKNRVKEQPSSLNWFIGRVLDVHD